MIESIHLSSYLPGVFTLLSEMWGVRLASLIELPLALSCGAALFMCFAARRSTAADRRFWSVLCAGSIVLSLAFALLLAPWIFPAGEILALFGSILELLAILIIGGTLIARTHHVYAASC